MTTRLQVLFPDDEIAAIRAAAASERVPVATWVRRVLREAIAVDGPAPISANRERSALVREAARHRYPPKSANPEINEFERLDELFERIDGRDDDADAMWDAEIARRLHQLRAGQSRLIPERDVFEAIDRMLGA